ncbi:MAG: LysR family transcriptional regulator substrate-binding protein, partial [Frisingicoccus sp.]
FAVLVVNSDYRHEDLSFTHLTDFQDIMIAGRAFSDLYGRTVSLKELMDYPLVSMEKGTMTRQFFDRFFQNHHLSPEPDIELATTDLIVPVITGGLGIGMVPEPFARAALTQGQIFRLTLKEAIPRREICLISISPSFTGEALFNIFQIIDKFFDTLAGHTAYFKMDGTGRSDFFRPISCASS